MFTLFLPQNFILFNCTSDIVATDLVSQAIVALPKGTALANEIAQVCAQIIF